MQLPGSVIIKGLADSLENNYPDDWIVELWSGDNKLNSRFLDGDGDFEFEGLSVNRDYTLYLRHPETNVVYSKIELNLTAGDEGSVIPDNFLLLDPEGVVYDSILRKAVKGAKITLVDENNEPVPDNYLLPEQQGQLTAADGQYKLVIDFGNAPNGIYEIEVDPTRWLYKRHAFQSYSTRERRCSDSIWK
ncbi:MAG: hypothetical protein U5K53_08555 [Halanaerobiales bacterium]|nr:hypothetical protein [Halanaerobiales bacterium]